MSNLRTDARDFIKAQGYAAGDLRRIYILRLADQLDEVERLWHEEVRKASRVSCIVPGCENHRDEGPFEGPLCLPCAAGLRSNGKHTHDAASRLIAAAQTASETTEIEEAELEFSGLAEVFFNAHLPGRTSREAQHQTWLAALGAFRKLWALRRAEASC